MKIAANIRLTGVAKELTIFGLTGIFRRSMFTNIMSQDIIVINWPEIVTEIGFALKNPSINTTTMNSINDFKIPT